MREFLELVGSLLAVSVLICSILVRQPRCTLQSEEERTRMPLERTLAVCGLELCFGSIRRDAQDFVIFGIFDHICG